MEVKLSHFVKKLQQYFSNRNEFFIIIGEEGLVCALFVDRKMESKMFVRSINAKDNKELDTLLKAYPDTEISIYLDVLDQSYIQKILPAIDIFNINALAHKRLEKETPPLHLKAALKIGRLPEGRRDWFYVFISAAYEPPISTWVDFLLQYQNPIIGIHFLPVEMASLIEVIEKNTTETMSFLPRVKKWWHNLRAKEATSKWIMLVVHNKSGGIRQVIYQNNKVVLTRLLTNIGDTNSEVMAGNIEQEIVNSIDYMKRIAEGSQDNFKLYIVVSAELKQFIRPEKLKTSEVHVYTPHMLSTILHLPSNISKEQDKFSEPLLLAILQMAKKKIITTYTETIVKTYSLHKIATFAKKGIAISIPVAIIAILYLINDSINLSHKINVGRSVEYNLHYNINTKNQTLAQLTTAFGAEVDVNGLLEVVNFHETLTKHYFNPLDLINKMARIRPEVIRVQSIDFDSAPKGVLYTKNIQATDNWRLSLAIKIFNANSNYDDLLKSYQSFNTELQKIFSGYNIKIGALPGELSFNQGNNNITINCEINNDKQGGNL